jgi:GNAT superfamily N-acetyltransferase
MEKVTVKPLSGDLLDDYFKFFDTVAFSDHEEWSWCYCTFYHLDESAEAALDGTGKEGMRNCAKTLIRDGALQGYLAYLDDTIVGWCNAGEKSNFPRLRTRKELWDADDSTVKIKSIVCFTVAPAMRGKGIAAQLLDRVCSDAAAEGFSCIEAYPVKGGRDCFYHYHGPLQLYAKKGFSVYRDFENDMIVRKALT